MPFFNRTEELTILEERWRSPRAEYLVLYGRRRIGKTELILRFAAGRRSIYFEASASTEGDQLEDLSRALAQVSGRELLATQPLTSWRAFFAAVSEELARGPLLVALDEFQFVARETPAVGSEINRFWREHRENPNLFLVLSGSDVSFFEREIVGYAATIYGRRTGQLHLQPFPFAELRGFFERWSAPNLVRAYAVLGGVPYYLEALNPGEGLARGIERHVLAPDGLLRQEPRFLFAQHSDLREGGVYFSILRAIAAGRTRRNEIAARVGRSDSATGQLLDRLTEMGLARRVHPATVAQPDRTKLVRFAIEDPFMRFWFRFVHPYEGRLHHREDARAHLQGVVWPALDDFVSRPAFEQICQSWLQRRVGAAAAGWWWGNVAERGERGLRSVQRELDAVAVDHEGRVIAVGSCKWTAGRVGAHEKALLNRLAVQLATDAEVPERFLFSRTGFAAPLRREAAADPRCHLVGIAELFDRA